MTFKRKPRPQIYIKNSSAAEQLQPTFEGLIQQFLADEKKHVEMRDVYLDLARDLAAIWKVLKDAHAPDELIRTQESLIRQEVERAWCGRVEFDTHIPTAFATNGFAMNLLTGEPAEYQAAVP